MVMSKPPLQTDANPPLYLHAELLPNIRQITLYISIPRNLALDATARPQIQLSDDGVFTKSPQNVTDTVKLPARVNDAARLILNSNTPPIKQSIDASHDYSFRMQIDPTDPTLMPKDELTDDHVPWTATDMSISTRIRCRTCSTPFLDASGPNIPRDECENELKDKKISGWMWKDLPSGNWAEMMDFWHCHKPDPHEDDPKSEAKAALKVEEENAQIKGYGAGSRVEAISGTVLIDVATFLVAESDCVGLKKGNDEEARSDPTSSQQRTLDCVSCNAIIGMEDPSANGWRLMKANVSLNTNEVDSVEEHWQSHPTELIVAAQLLELIERESARRFVVHFGQKSGLLLWVFNPDLRYSNSNSGHSISAQQAMKVLFQTTEDVDSMLNRDMGRPSPLSLEELELPSMIYQALWIALTRSNQMLPLSARNFNEWTVGLLDRYSRATRN
ncbi:hypothetical protein N7466_006108 [Penicillium verhagenii]|uniref:uncharacterized protein n=1 Tax=Penicillium verhagenii TaxID=1562060 RepID=UPI0025456293|nr:uncharacterized protein N7466_006108 [Penicillium verhagenii]KAJ5930615.1 hypothetical protein N7466_006108 [Penicillium verhagenii]